MLTGRGGVEISVDVIGGGLLVMVGVGRDGEDVVVSGARLAVGDADKRESRVGSIVVWRRESVVRPSGMDETSLMELRISSRSGCVSMRRGICGVVGAVVMVVEEGVGVGDGCMVDLE